MAFLCDRLVIYFGLYDDGKGAGVCGAGVGDNNVSSIILYTLLRYT